MNIQNPGRFRTQDIFRILSRYILAYSERCVMLTNWKPFHIQNFAIFRILTNLGPEVYSESCLFRHIQAYSDIFNNDSYNNINFLFFTLIWHTFQRNLKRHTCFLTAITSIPMLVWVYLNNMWFLKIAL